MRSVLRALTVAALPFAAALPRAAVIAPGGTTHAAPPITAAGPGGYKLDPGPWKASSENLVLHDDRRKKDLEITVRFPLAEAGSAATFPLVVFSHGAGGSRAAFTALTTHWASHGYVVVLPTHADSIELRRRHGEDLSRLAASLDSLLTDVKPLDRLADITFVLDALGIIEQQVPALRTEAGRGRISREHIGMAGHSAGALTTQMAFGVKVRPVLAGSDPAALRSLGNPRIAAAILISGQGTTNRMFTDRSWSDLEKPMLVITGSRDVAAIGKETPASRREPFDKAKPGGKYLLFIEGATHSSYQGRGPALALDPSIPTAGELEMITGVTSSATLAFLDAYLKDDSAARAYLGSDALAAFSQKKATLERK